MEKMKSESGIIHKTLQYGLISGLLISAGACFWGIKAAAGMAIGAAFGLGGLAFAARLIPFAFATRQPKIWLWLAWIFKFPLLGILLYVLIVRGLVNPITFCLGLSLVPIMLTLQGCLAAKREAA